MANFKTIPKLSIIVPTLNEANTRMLETQAADIFDVSGINTKENIK